MAAIPDGHEDGRDNIFWSKIDPQWCLIQVLSGGAMVVMTM